MRLAVPGRVPAGEHPADRVARPWRPEGPAVGPMPSLQSAALDTAQATQLLHALRQRLRPSQGEEELDAGSPCPDDGTSLTAQGAGCRSWGDHVAARRR